MEFSKLVLPLKRPYNTPIPSSMGVTKGKEHKVRQQLTGNSNGIRQLKEIIVITKDIKLFAQNHPNNKKTTGLLYP